jgi:TolB protein
VKTLSIALVAVLASITIGLLDPVGCSPPRAGLPLPFPYGQGQALSSAETRPDGAARLTTPPTGASDQNPAFPPKGSRLVFTRFDTGYNDGPAGLFRLNLGNGQIIRLTPVEDQDNVNLPGAVWNAVNNRIIFSSDRQEADDLWRIAPDGTDFSRVTTHTGLPMYIEPSWSPDGQWIVFEATQSGNSEDGRIGQVWKVRADGTSLTQLTDGTYDDRQPNWSTAGDRVLFQRRTLPDGQWDIYTIAPDGSDPQNVTSSSTADETDASWSPSGACIVYSSDNGELPVPNILVIPATGGQPTRVTFSEAHEDGAPSWSSDGRWIAFESHEGQSESSPTALWRIAAPKSMCDPFHAYLPTILASVSSP